MKAAMAMRLQAVARPKAKAIQLTLNSHPVSLGGKGVFELEMDGTLSDLADNVVEMDILDSHDDYVDVPSWYYFTTVGGTVIPMNLTAAPLIHVGLISDGAKLLIIPQWTKGKDKGKGKGKGKGKDMC